MATLDDVRRIALELPEVFERGDGFAGSPVWRTKKGNVVWVRGPRKTDLAQLEALGRSWPVGAVVGIFVGGDDVKQDLLAMHPDALFTIPHFDGYPAVLAKLGVLGEDLLKHLIIDAWTTRVTKRVAKEWLAGQGQAT